MFQTGGPQIEYLAGHWFKIMHHPCAMHGRTEVQIQSTQRFEFRHHKDAKCGHSKPSKTGGGEVQITFMGRKVRAGLELRLLERTNIYLNPQVSHIHWTNAPTQGLVDNRQNVLHWFNSCNYALWTVEDNRFFVFSSS